MSLEKCRCRSQVILLVTVSCLLLTSCAGLLEMAGEVAIDRMIAYTPAPVYPILCISEPASRPFTTTEPTARVCGSLTKERPHPFTVEIVVENKSNGYANTVKVSNTDSTSRRVEWCTSDNVPLNPGKNKIKGSTPWGGRNHIVIIRVAGE